MKSVSRAFRVAIALAATCFVGFASDVSMLHAQSGQSLTQRDDFEGSDDDLSLRDLLESSPPDVSDKEDSDEDEMSLDDLLGETDGDPKDTDDDSPDDRESDDWEDESDEQEKLASGAAATSAAIARLRRPLRELRVGMASGDQRVPEDRAAFSVGSSDPVLISSAGVALPKYRRATAGWSHRPLYFEQANLERCGNGRGCLQNPISAVHFVSSTLALPYQMAKQRHACGVCRGGDCRCGQSMPFQLDRPIDCRGAVVELATLAGFTFLLL